MTNPNHQGTKRDKRSHGITERIYKCPVNIQILEINHLCSKMIFKVSCSTLMDIYLDDTLSYSDDGVFNLAQITGNEPWVGGPELYHKIG